MHGPEAIIEHVADWRPFSYFTLEYPMRQIGEGELMRHTYEFRDTGKGPTMTLRIFVPTPGAKAWWLQSSEGFLQGVEASLAVLFQLLEDA